MVFDENCLCELQTNYKCLLYVVSNSTCLVYVYICAMIIFLLVRNDFISVKNIVEDIGIDGIEL